MQTNVCVRPAGGSIKTKTKAPSLMAIYHASVKTVSRSKGHSAIAAAAYRAGVSLMDRRTGVRHDYSRRLGVVSTVLYLPDNCPEWATDLEAVWNQAEFSENRKNSTVAREFEFSLPHELTDEKRRQLAEDVSRSLVSRYGFIVQASIHAPPKSGDSRNHHVHLLTTTRRINTMGFNEKTRELDDLTKCNGISRGQKEVCWFRQLVQERCNHALKEAGFSSDLDCRSLQNQFDDSIDASSLPSALHALRTPTKHAGKSQTALRRKGQLTEIYSINEYIQGDNSTIFKTFFPLIDKSRNYPCLCSHVYTPPEESQAPFSLAPVVEPGRLASVLISTPLLDESEFYPAALKTAHCIDQALSKMTADLSLAQSVSNEKERLFFEMQSFNDAKFRLNRSLSLVKRQRIKWKKSHPLRFFFSRYIDSDFLFRSQSEEKKIISHIERFDFDILRISKNHEEQSHALSELLNKASVSQMDARLLYRDLNESTRFFLYSFLTNAEKSALNLPDEPQKTPEDDSPGVPVYALKPKI